MRGRGLQDPEGGRGWSLHGGTLLAMRWDGHRESTDIDLLLGAVAVTTLWEMVDGPRLTGLDERFWQADVWVGRFRKP